MDERRQAASSVSSTTEGGWKKSALKGRGERAVSTGNSVSFAEVVTVKALPYWEQDAAVLTRKGEWASAPPVDELWDGEGRTFWERELTPGELRRRLLVRSLRGTLLFNLGFAFNGIISNFRRRVFAQNKDDNVGERFDPFKRDVPEFGSAKEEDVFLRGELFDLLAESNRRLKDADAKQDSEAFDELYKGIVLPEFPKISDVLQAQSKEEYNLASLGMIEKVIDEIMNVDEVREAVGLPLINPDFKPSESLTPDEVLIRAHKNALLIASEDGRNVPSLHYLERGETSIDDMLFIDEKKSDDEEEAERSRMESEVDINFPIFEAEKEEDAPKPELEVQMPKALIFVQSTDQAFADGVQEILSPKRNSKEPSEEESATKTTTGSTIKTTAEEVSSIRRESLTVVAKRDSISSPERRESATETTRRESITVAARKESLTLSPRRESVTSPVRRESTTVTIRRESIIEATRRESATAIAARRESIEEAIRMEAAVAAARRGSTEPARRESATGTTRKESLTMAATAKRESRRTSKLIDMNQDDINVDDLSPRIILRGDGTASGFEGSNRKTNGEKRQTPENFVELAAGEKNKLWSPQARVLTVFLPLLFIFLLRVIQNLFILLFFQRERNRQSERYY